MAKDMKMPSVMGAQHSFARVPQATIPRSQFDRSHGHKTNFDANVLVPIYLDEALPGDTFQLRMSGFARLQPTVTPIMDNLYLDTFFFAVPMRLLWNNWEKFNGAQTDPGDSTSYTIPQQTPPSAGYTSGHLEDHFGLPVDVATTTTSWTHSALPRRAYEFIYDEWFRDENLVDSTTWGQARGDGPDSTSAGGTDLRKRGKRHDYFTSCLPWLQKGTALSLSDTFAVVPETGGNQIPKFKGAAAGNAPLQAKTASATPDIRASAGTGSFTTNESLIWDDPQLEVEPTFTINEMRQAFQLQKLLERDARGGTRYTEVIKAHFGVTSPDYRMQRPEYLGGGSTPIMIASSAQTSEDGTTPQANLAGIGTAMAMGHGFVKSFTEHCILIGIANVRADLTYFQGIERFWSRSTRYDFYWPALAQIGEQSVLNKEIYLNDDSSDASVFGYVPRYEEYRYKPSRVTNLMRPGVTGTLEIWNLTEEFGSRPTLNQTFIEEATPLDRCVATPSEPHFNCDFWFDLKCARPMPVFGVPGMIDHF